MAANRLVVSEFGTAAFPDPCKTIFQRFQTQFRKLSGKDFTPPCARGWNCLQYGTNNYRHKNGPHYVVVKIPPTFGSVDTCFKQAEIIAEIPVTNARYPSYYHSFEITKDKLIFIESPSRLELLKTFKTFWTNQSLDSTIVWKPELNRAEEGIAWPRVFSALLRLSSE
ncbi:unnamed protein product [Allacma fusca]|uniref:Uncharacterized protein n=1 Tax=Allacma fusca TaxID=39272 RepID=A0A8J2LIE0_9HEXA|nr:unnamed protein product [Allacma fusca]